MRRYTWSLAIICFLVILLAAPLVIFDRYNRIALQSGAVFAASNNTYSLSAPIRLMSGPTIELERGTLSLPPSRSGLARGGQVIAMLITGNGPQLTLDHATFTADFSTREPTFTQDETAAEVAPLVKSLQSLQFNDLAVRNSIVRIKMSDGSILTLDDVVASVSAKPNGSLHAAGSFHFRGEKIEFDTTLGASLDAQGMSRPASATFTGKPLSATIDGSLMLGESPQLLSSQAELIVRDLRAAARWLGVNWPSGHGFGAFRAKGQLEWLNRTVAFQNAAIELDENDASGTLSVNFAGPRPTVEGTLGLKTLDLTQYLKAPEPGTRTPDLLTAIRGASGLEFPLIDAVDADFRISSDSVTLPATTIGRSAATVSLRSGKMLADLAELEFSDGTRGAGQIRIDQSGTQPNYSIQAKLESSDVGNTIKAFVGHPTVQGRGSVTIDLTATGDTGESLLNSMGGKLSATLTEGGRIGLDINKLSSPAVANAAAASWLEVGTGAISVDKLEARFTVLAGVIRAQSVEAVSGERALQSHGAISLVEHRLDLEIVLGDVIKSVAEGDATASAAAIKMQPRQVIELHGPWSAPTISARPAEGSQSFTPPSPG